MPEFDPSPRSDDGSLMSRGGTAFCVGADGASYTADDMDEARALYALGAPEASVLIPLLHSRRYAEADAALLVQLGEWRAYGPGATLCEQGELCDAMFFVAPGHGSVMVEVEVGHVGGPVQALHTGLHGALVGATSLLTRAPCGYSVVAIERTWVLAIDHAAVKTLFTSHPHTLIRLQRIALLQEPLNTRRLRIMSRLWLAGGWSGANFDQVTVRAAQGDRIRRAFLDGGDGQGDNAAAGGDDRPGPVIVEAPEEFNGPPRPPRQANTTQPMRIDGVNAESAQAAHASGVDLVPPLRKGSLLCPREGSRSVSALLDSAATATAAMPGCQSDSALALRAPVSEEDLGHEGAAHFEPTLLRLREFSAEIIGKQRSIADMAARWGAMFEVSEPACGEKEGRDMQQVSHVRAQRTARTHTRKHCGAVGRDVRGERPAVLLARPHPSPPARGCASPPHPLLLPHPRLHRTGTRSRSPPFFPAGAQGRTEPPPFCSLSA
jgi:CRP-like cAMP-binding protein